MTSFTYVVDQIIAETRRLANARTICDAVMSTLWEMQRYQLTKDSPLLYSDSDLISEQVTITGRPFMWPRPANLVKLQYAELVDQYGQKQSVRIMRLGSGITNSNRALPNVFLSGAYYTFSNITESGFINISYYSRFPKLVYYGTNISPSVPNPGVTWDEASQSWDFDDPLLTPDQQEALLALNTNWALERYSDIVMAGSKAKLWLDVGEKQRAGGAYALYQSLAPRLQVEFAAPAA